MTRIEMLSLSKEELIEMIMHRDEKILEYETVLEYYWVWSNDNKKASEIIEKWRGK